MATPKEQVINIKIKGQTDSSFNTSVNAASDKLRAMGDSAKGSSGGLDSASRSVSGLESALVSAGVVAAVGAMTSAMMECVAAADQYEAALAKVETIADTSAVSMATVRGDLTELSNETGVAVTDLSEAAYQAISASVDSAQAVAFVGEANKLAVGGFTDAASAVDVLTTSLNAYNLDASQAANISDMLITTQNLGKTTVNDLASNMGNVIPTAAALNTNMANLATSYALMTKQGINTATSTTQIRAMLNELSKAGSVVSDTLINETGKSFSTLMGEGKNLGEVLDILYQSVEGDSTGFKNLWGNARAGQGALALVNAGADEFNSTLSKMENSAGATSKAYQTMADTAEHSKQVFENSAKNMQIAIGETLSPSIEAMYELGADVMKGITAFVEANPEVVSAVTGLAVGVGAFTAVIVGAKVAMIAFNAVCAVNPFVLLAGAIAAVTVAVGSFAVASDKAKKSADVLTFEAQRQKDEIDKLNGEYDKAVEKYGKLSDEAQTLKGKIDDLETAYGNSTQKLSDLLTKQGEISDRVSKLLTNDDLVAIEDEEARVRRLTNQLYSMASQTQITSSTQKKMQAIIDELNNTCEGLNLTYEDVIKNSDGAKQSTQDYLNTLYDKKKLENATSKWIEAQDVLADQEEEYKRLSEQAAAAGEAVTAAKKAADENDPYAANKMIEAEREYEAQMEKMVTYTNSAGETVEISLRDALNVAEQNVWGLKETTAQYEQEVEKLSGKVDKNAESTKTWQTVTSDALTGVQPVLDKLATAYENAFDTAYKGISNTIGLTTDLTNKTDYTTQKLNDLWENQESWITNYSANIEKAKKLNLSDELIASLSDGSEQSGQLLNQIVTELEGLNDHDASELAEKLNKNFEDVGKAEKSFAKTAATYNKDVNEAMGEAKSIIDKSVEGMDLGEEAKKNAKNTLIGYKDGIIEELRSEDFTSALAAVNNAVAKYLTPNNISLPENTNLEENANGTRNAANVFLAGEKGPELVVGAGGSRVFTASETRDILAASQTAAAERVVGYDYAALAAQVGALASKKAVSLSELADSLNSGVFQSVDNSSSPITVQYSPTFTLSGTNGGLTVEDVKEAARLSQREFERLMKEYERSRKRVSFGGAKK